MPALARVDVRMCAALVTTALGLVPVGQAHGDADEASLHGQVTAGLARTRESGAVGTGPILGVAGRFTLARSDLLAYAVEAGGTYFASHHDDAKDEQLGVTVLGTIDRAHVAGRIGLGLDARFGSSWSPVVRAGLGIQARYLAATTFKRASGLATDLSALTSIDATAALGLGLDHRLGRSLVVGAAVTATRAQPLTGDAAAVDAVEASVHVAWYFYPRWRPLAVWRGAPGGEP